MTMDAGAGSGSAAGSGFTLSSTLHPHMAKAIGPIDRRNSEIELHIILSFIHNAVQPTAIGRLCSTALAALFGGQR